MGVDDHGLQPETPHSGALTLADESGFSQQDPADSATPYNSDTFVTEQLIAKISTLKPVKVIAVKVAAPGRGTVDVQPMVNQLDGNNRATPHGTVYGIPYRSWKYGKNAILADPVVGDEGVMVCADRDISAVKATNDIAPPGSSRRYDVADGVYLGGMFGTDDPEQWVKFTDTGIEVHDKNSNTITTSSTGINWSDTNSNALISNAAGISINGVLFNRTGQVAGDLPVTGALQIGGSIEDVAGGTYAGNIHTTGEVTAGTIGLKAHHHTAQGALAPTTISQP